MNRGCIFYGHAVAAALDPVAQDEKRFIGWVCTEPGTDGTLNVGNTEGFIAAGSTELTVSDVRGIEKGQYITIAGTPCVSKTISDMTSEPMDALDPNGPQQHKYRSTRRLGYLQGQQQ